MSLEVMEIANYRQKQTPKRVQGGERDGVSRQQTVRGRDKRRLTRTISHLYLVGGVGPGTASRWRLCEEAEEEDGEKEE